MAITYTGSFLNIGNAHVLIGNGTISGTGTTDITATVASTLTVAGIGTDISLSNLGSVGVVTNLAVTGGAHLTLNGVTGISALTTYTIGTGSKLTFAAGIGLTVLPTINFGDSTGQLELGNGVNVDLGESIANFAPGSSIDFDGATYNGGAYNGSTLTLTGPGGVTRVVPITNNAFLAGEYFHVASDGNGGTLLTLNAVAAGGIPACYVRGTLIMTELGEVAVEALCVGDMLVTASGALRPLRWVGTRSYAGRFLAANPAVRPVRITAGALGPMLGRSLPRRDLLISPKHAMLLDGVLIPAWALENGTTIATDHQVTEVDYFHLELDEHDTVLAEGAPSESYVEDANRGMFHNAASHAALYPGAQPAPARYCAPRVEDGYALEAVKARLAAAPIRGKLERSAGDVLVGWAQCAGQSEPVQLDILAGGDLLGRIMADQPRADLAAAGVGTGRHGFVLPLGRALPPGTIVEIRRTMDGMLLESTTIASQAIAA